MSSNQEPASQQLPFFPTYQYELLHNDDLRITWFESKFSQSRYNFENTNIRSNACTIIVILLAAKCHKNKIYMFGPETNVNYFLVKALGECILEGNAIHGNLKRRGALDNVNLTVPEGVRYAGAKQLGLREWRCNVYLQPLGLTLYRNLKNQWNDWLRSDDGRKGDELFVVLISDTRSVLFVLDSNMNTITLIDSHQHTCDKGAVVATASRQKMKCLCNWFVRAIFDCYRSTPLLYELSFLYFKRKGESQKRWKVRLKPEKWKIFRKNK